MSVHRAARTSPRPAVPGATAVVVAVGLLLGVALAARGPHLVPDSTSYLDNAPHRPPAYPLFLDLTGLAGRALGLRLAVLLQALGATVATARLGLALRRLLGLGGAATALVLAVLAIAPLNYAADISTECLTWAAFALLLAEASELLLGDGGWQHLVRAAGWAVLAILLRPQLLFLWPVLGGAVVLRALVLGGRGAWLRHGLLLAGALLATSAVQVTYNYARNGRPQGIHFTGVQLLTVALYNADPGDAALFAGEVRPVADRLFSRMAGERLFASARPLGSSTAAWFERGYVTICLDVIEREVAGGEPTSAEGWAALDKTTMTIALGLLRAHPTRLPRHVVAIAYAQLKYFLILMAGLTLVALVGAREQARSRWLLLVGGLWWSNVVLVCLVETPMTRYTCYTDALACAAVIALLAAPRDPPAATS